MNTPPASNKLLTPNEPRLSILPKPNGNFSVGGLSAQLTVASVMISETISVRLCIASAERAVEDVRYALVAVEGQWCNATLGVEDIASYAFGDGHEQVDVEAYPCNADGRVHLVGGGEELVRAVTMAVMAAMAPPLLGRSARHEVGEVGVVVVWSDGWPSRRRPSVVKGRSRGRVVHADRGRLQGSGTADTSITVQPRGDSQS
jgi:hypothetical protein